jgi:hypothetical protein
MRERRDERIDDRLQISARVVVTGSCAAGVGGISTRICWAIRYSLGWGQHLGLGAVGQRCARDRSGAALPLQTWYRTRRGGYQCGR